MSFTDLRNTLSVPTWRYNDVYVWTWTSGEIAVIALSLRASSWWWCVVAIVAIVGWHRWRPRIPAAGKGRSQYHLDLVLSLLATLVVILVTPSFPQVAPWLLPTLSATMAWACISWGLETSWRRAKKRAESGDDIGDIPSCCA